jgi:hypothetical protein
MPRIINPGAIRSGKSKVEKIEASVNSSPGDAIVISPAWENPEASVVDLPAWVVGGRSPEAEMTTVDSEFLSESSVSGAVEELANSLPPEPPKLGRAALWTEFNCIPDWGALKLNQPLLAANLTTDDVYPHHYIAPSPALVSSKLGITQQGVDPNTDTEYNNSSLSGGGSGQCFAGGFNRDGDLIETKQIIYWDTWTYPDGIDVVVSGCIYPADRGVLALIHWPAGGDVTAFLNQDLDDRCVAALLLGQGLYNAGPVTTPCGNPCDGEPGGIFISSYEGSIYNFPGRATGQYDLKELHTGFLVNSGGLLAVKTLGDQHTHNDNIPASGQVRLGTVIEAGEDVLPYGIPILGGSKDAYDNGTLTSPGALNGHLTLGRTILQYSSNEEPNFFAMRLPYLQNYNTLAFVPQGDDPLATYESLRYFIKQSHPLSVSTHTSAGDYVNFSQNCFNYQIARFRHAFITSDQNDAGTYLLLHFKKENDFELFVRDGIMPWDSTYGYELYGSYSINGNDFTDNDNIVNSETTINSPKGPAPSYGYANEFYHCVRNNLYQEDLDVISQIQSDDASNNIVAEFEWQNSGTTTNIMYCSGVAYFTPVNKNTGASEFSLQNISISYPTSFWDNTYATIDSQLTDYSDAPALMSSCNPVIISFPSFAYGESASTDGKPSLSVNADPDSSVGWTNFVGSDDFPRFGRIEIPYTHCGTHGGNQFSASNAPASGDDISITGPTDLELEGDTLNPSFSTDCRMQLYLRTPLGQNESRYCVLPSSGVVDLGVPSVRAASVRREQGVEFSDITDTTGYQILMHTTGFRSGSSDYPYGNFVNAIPPIQANANLFTATKDAEERFLDETYRYIENFDGAALDAYFGNGAKDAIRGPGLSTWIGGPIDMPVRAGRQGSSLAWSTSSWITQTRYDNALNNTTQDLQVAGLPARLPSALGSAKNAFPSCGILMYPQDDYTDAAIRPSSTDHVSISQPDYTGLTGIRHYIRAFDVGFTRSGDPLDLSGTTRVILRFDGIKLSDLQYVAPGPGRLSNTGIAILAKVPGLTTWMDMGRNNGSGPSKQDTLLDGAGCKVLGPNTFNGIDYDKGGINYCQIEIELGPSASLFANGDGEFPLLIKVMMDEDVQKFNMRYYFDEDDRLFGAASAYFENESIRGLCGISIIRD